LTRTIIIAAAAAATVALALGGAAIAKSPSLSDEQVEARICQLLALSDDRACADFDAVDAPGGKPVREPVQQSLAGTLDGAATDDSGEQPSGPVTVPVTR
jgi:hypothetical protein